MPDFDSVPAHAYASLASWLQHRIDAQDELDEQWREQERIVGGLNADGWPGRCPVCAAARRFIARLPVTDIVATLREEMRCRDCGLSARQRGGLALLAEGLASDAGIFLTEQASIAFVRLQRAYPQALGAEYGFSPSRRRRLQARLRAWGGQGAIRREDITALSFADASLDAIGCFDVLEHVPDYRLALREFARCLRAGGRLLLTVPFLPLAQDTLVRARHDGYGVVEHLHPPELHGDPLGGGVLCYFHFGWDLLDVVRAAGFAEAAWCRTWSPDQALFNLWTLRAIR